MSKFKSILFFIFLCFLVFTIFKLFANYNAEILWPNYKEFNTIKIGMSQTQVEEILGKPYKVYYKNSAPENYYIDGRNYRKRDITNKVYIYLKEEPIAYIYFDQSNRVEYVYVGGS